MIIDKNLVAASATPLALAVLTEGRSFGYAILKRAGELSGGGPAWNDGMLHPLPHRLEHDGLVETVWGRPETGRRRKHWRLPRAGGEQLERQRRQRQVVERAMRGVRHLAFDAALQST